MKCFFPIENSHFGRPKTNFNGFETGPDPGFAKRGGRVSKLGLKLADIASKQAEFA